MIPSSNQSIDHAADARTRRSFGAFLSCVFAVFVWVGLPAQPGFGQTQEDPAQEQNAAAESDEPIRRIRGESDREARRRRLEDLNSKAGTLRREFERLRAEFESVSREAGRGLETELDDARTAITEMFANRHLESETKTKLLMRRMTAAWKTLESSDVAVSESSVFSSGHDLPKQWLSWYVSSRVAEREASAKSRSVVADLVKETRDRPSELDSVWLSAYTRQNEQVQDEASKQRTRWLAAGRELSKQAAELRSWSEAIDDDERLLFTQLADLMLQQRNTYSEQRWVSFRESMALLSKERSDLLAVLAGKLSKSRVDVLENAAPPAESVNSFANQLQKRIASTTMRCLRLSDQWVQCSRVNRHELEDQLEDLQHRRELSDLEKQSLAGFHREIGLKYEESGERLMEATTSRSIALRDEIDRLKNLLVAQDSEGRAILIEQIEVYQLELDRVRSLLSTP